MSVKNQKNLIAVGGVAVALLIGPVLLGGFAKNEPAVTEAVLCRQSPGKLLRRIQVRRLLQR